MSDTHRSKAPLEDLSPDEKTTLLFVQMVFQLSGLATMMMGKAPNPDTGNTMRDLEAARLLIDQLEMLEVKTRGNLTAEETQVLRQNLTNLRLAFVETVSTPGEPAAAPAGEPRKATPETEAEPSHDSESKVKYSKKY